MSEIEEEIAIDLEEIGERYEEKGFFKRLSSMFKGFKYPRDSREYKLARIELQRLMAPLIAILTVSIFVIVLIVVTAVTSQVKDVIQVNVQEIQEEEAPLEETPEETPEDIEPPPEDVEITVDTIDPGSVSQITPVQSPPSEQVSVKPSPQDTVAFVDSPVQMKSMVGSRNPGSIGAATKGGAGYGDPSTEACVLKVLWWLKDTQLKSGPHAGSWDSRAIAQKHKHKSVGHIDHVANAAFAILTYLAHGEYPGSPSPYSKDFGPVVQNAIDYLLTKLDTTGAVAKFPIEKPGNHEYEFCIATYALCEAYGMTQNPNCKDAAEKCMERIIKAQNRDGGWWYNLNPKDTTDDLSFGGWAIQALKAGKMAGLHPDGLDQCIKKAINCLQTKNHHNGAFTYNQNSRHHKGLTATGCLAMQLLGYGGKPEVRHALDYMKDWMPSFEPFKGTNIDKDCPSPQYYCYYAAQCKYQAGMKKGATKEDEQLWQKWNVAMKKLYTSSIVDLEATVKDKDGKGHKQGYFCNKDQWSTPPIMDTCLAALQLMVYYRYLPTTQTKAGEEVAELETAVSNVLDSNDVSVDVDI